MEPVTPPDADTPIAIRVAGDGLVHGCLGYEHPDRDVSPDLRDVTTPLIALTEELLRGLAVLAGFAPVVDVHSACNADGRLCWHEHWPQFPVPGPGGFDGVVTVVSVRPAFAVRDPQDPRLGVLARALQVGAHAHWMEAGATAAQTLHGVRISTTEFLDGAVVVQTGLGVWVDLVGGVRCPGADAMGWLARCERYLDRYIARAPGTPWCTSWGARLIAVGASVAPRTVLVLDDVDSVEAVCRWARLMVHQRGACSVA